MVSVKKQGFIDAINDFTSKINAVQVTTQKEAQMGMTVPPVQAVWPTTGYYVEPKDNLQETRDALALRKLKEEYEQSTGVKLAHPGVAAITGEMLRSATFTTITNSTSF